MVEAGLGKGKGKGRGPSFFLEDVLAGGARCWEEKLEGLRGGSTLVGHLGQVCRGVRWWLWRLGVWLHEEGVPWKRLASLGDTCSTHTPGQGGAWASGGRCTGHTEARVMSLQGGRSACPVPLCAVDPELSLHLDWMQPRGQAWSRFLMRLHHPDTLWFGP